MSQTRKPSLSSSSSLSENDDAKSGVISDEEINEITQKDIFGSDTASESEDNESIISEDKAKTHSNSSKKIQRDSYDSGNVDRSAPRAYDNLSDSATTSPFHPPYTEEAESAKADSESSDEGFPLSMQRAILHDGGDEPQSDDEHIVFENEEQEAPIISVDFPLIRLDLGRDLHMVKLPNFLSVETRPFDPVYYEDELGEGDVLDEEGRTRLKLKVENTIRWRTRTDERGEVVNESNARIVRWSDGSLSLHLGDEIFDVHKMDIQSDFNHLFVREGNGLQGQAVFKTKLTFRPHSTDSFTHRKITLSLADKTSKSQKVKILPVAGADPDSNRNELMRKEEEKLRASIRRDSQQRRMRERQLASAALRQRRPSLTKSYAEDDSPDEANTISLAALKRNSKAKTSFTKPGLSAIYSEESESDFSDTPVRKKTKISDEEESN